MSTTANAAPPANPAVAAPSQPAPGAGALKTVPRDIRNRALGETPPDKKPDLAPPPAAAAPPVPPVAGAPDPAAPPSATPAAGTPPAPEDPTKLKKVKPGPALPLAEPAAPDLKTLVTEALREQRSETIPPAPALKPEEQVEIELALFASKTNQSAYGDLPTKITQFYTARDQLLTSKAAELGGQNSPEFKDYLESDEFKNWLRETRPSYRRGDKERLQNELQLEKARVVARKEIEPELEELRRRQSELEHTPAIRAKTQKALSIILAETEGEKDPALEAFLKDPKALADQHPLDASVIATEANTYVDRITKAYKIEHGIMPIDKNDADQRWLGTFMAQKDALLREKNPTGVEMADGKILVDLQTLEKLAKQKVPGLERYRTFTTDEIVGMIAATGQAEVRKRLKVHRENVSRSIYVKKPDGPPANPSGQPPAAPEDDPASPGAPVSAAPSASANRRQEENKSLGRKYA